MDRVLTKYLGVITYITKNKIKKTYHPDGLFFKQKKSKVIYN